MLPPLFEPNGPCQAAWFPRPITDEIESPLDLLERLEEDRKRRLRAIAQVPARTPVGLQSSSSGDAGPGPSSSPGPGGGGPHHHGPAVGNANYGRYRYYPPARDGDGADASAVLHQTYSLDRLSPSVTGRSGERQEQRRRVRAARRPNPRRSGGDGRASIDTGASLSSAADSSADRGFVNDASYRSGAGGRPSFVRSPAFDPRAGGGGASRRSLGGAASRLSFGGASVGSSFRYPRLSVDTSAAEEEAAATTRTRELSGRDYITPTARSGDTLVI